MVENESNTVTTRGKSLYLLLTGKRKDGRGKKEEKKRNYQSQRERRYNLQGKVHDIFKSPTSQKLCNPKCCDRISKHFTALHLIIFYLLFLFIYLIYLLFIG